MEPINWEPILWFAGVFVTIITGLLTVIAFLIWADKKRSNGEFKDFRDALTMHDKWIREQQKEIHELNVYTKTATEQNTEAIKFIKDLYFRRKK